MHNVPHGYLNGCSGFLQLTDVTETAVSHWQRRYRTKSFTIFHNSAVQKPPSIYIYGKVKECFIIQKTI